MLHDMTWVDELLRVRGGPGACHGLLPAGQPPIIARTPCP